MLGRWSLVVLSLAAIALQLVGLFAVPWFHFQVDDLIVEIYGARVPAAWGLDVGTPFAVGASLARLGSLYLVIRLGITLYSLVADRPVHPWLAFRSAGRALVQVAVVAVIAVIATLLVPELTMGHEVLDFPLIRGWGCELVLAGIVLGGGVLLVARRDPELADLLGWVPTEELPEPRREREMTRPPLPSPPVVELDPFRAPPQVAALRVIETAPAPRPAQVVADADAPAPKLLR